MAGGPSPERRREFEEVALPHLDSLYNLALKLTRHAGNAEDLVQETYLRAFRFFDSYRSGTHIRAWLFRILRNTFINRYRAARARPDEVDFSRVEAVYERVVSENFLDSNRPHDPEQILMAGVLDGEIQEAIGALSEEYRSVVILALIEQLSYKEIASALSIPIGTVMSRLHRGRKLLQASLLGFAERKGILRTGPGVETQGGEAGPETGREN